MPALLALRRFRRVAALAGAMLAAAPAAAQDGAPPLAVDIAFVAHARAPSPPYVLDAPPPGEGADGAKLALEDDSTTGAFLNQTFALQDLELGASDKPADAVRPLLAKGVRLFVSALPADETLALADALKGSGAILFNAQAQDESLRGADCRENLFHTAPSRAMLTDALAQYLAVRRWSRILLVSGPKPNDKAYAQAVRASAKKFGLRIVADIPWSFGPLARARSDSITEAAALTFARGVEADILVVADENDDFGDYILYRTAEPRLVAGTQGLSPVSWSPTHTAYGAEQLQNRFIRMAKRRMRPIDFQAWMAVRAIGEAVTETGSNDPAKIAADMQKPSFNLAIFKGLAASFRPWSRQLRQSIVLAQPRALVALAPLPEFLHQFNTLDTLGADRNESACPFKAAP
jgi:ABC transporter substrate binding protein (PQQ-dependent alcohol dehydrogenase system)